jgi:hypothetical protein
MTADATATRTHTDGVTGIDIELKVLPGIADKQNLRLLLNGLSPTTGTFMFEIRQFAVPGPGPATDITIPISDIPNGTYLIRLQVDGAESPILSDATGQYVKPKVVIA